MFVADSHCDSIELVALDGSSLVNRYNFSKNHRQLQLVAFFCGHPDENGEQSYKRALSYFESFDKAMKAERDVISFARNYSDVENAFLAGRHAAVLAIEGGAGINGSKANFFDFYNRGVRVFGMCWSCNDLASSSFASGTADDRGLTSFGKEIVREGNRLGMIFDVSHMSDKSFYDALALSEKPIIATHSNFRSVCRNPRNLTDDMAKEIFCRGGVVGLNLYTDFISDDEKERTVAGLFRHIDHALDLGGEDHICFGCDIDGIDDKIPSPLTKDKSFHDAIIEQMLSHNYSESLVRKIAGQNLLDFLRKYL